ncbi:MAG: DUF1127 domain-containing protein [Gammaproteobacteria bacterium]|nr:DUF1127 domain-containing protein [Gammaproteobacteria bacterium]
MKTATFDTAPAAVVHRGSGISDMIRKSANAMSTWHKRRMAIRELYALSDRQLADIGLIRGEIPTVVDKLLKS